MTTTLREAVARSMFAGYVSMYTWSDLVEVDSPIISECYEDADRAIATIRDALVAAAGDELDVCRYIEIAPHVSEYQSETELATWLTATLTPDAPMTPVSEVEDGGHDYRDQYIEACQSMIGEYDNFVNHLLAAYDDIRPMPKHMVQAQDRWRDEYKRYREACHTFVSHPDALAPAPASVAWWMRNLPDDATIGAIQLNNGTWMGTINGKPGYGPSRDAALDAALRNALEREKP